jgi:hypothetical protein
MSADLERTGRMDDEHVTDLLPSYVRDALPAAIRLRVQDHLAACVLCRDELALATAVVEGDQRRLQAVPVPSFAVLDRVWAEIDAPARHGIPAWWSDVVRQLRLVWSLLRAQMALIPKGVWVASGGALSVALLISSVWRDGAFPPFLLGLLLTPAAAASVAVLCDPEADPGLEVALATPTSPRLTLFARFVLVYIYNTALALGGTLFLSIAHRVDFALLASYWVGPMLLLASVGLVLTVRFGAFIGAVVVSGIWCLRVLGFVLTQATGQNGVDASLPVLWRTSPAIVFAAAGLLIIAAIALPTELRAVRDR